MRVEYHMSNSRFIATAGHADSVEAARAFIKAVREEMPDAHHHVYAFKVGYGESVIEGMSDDGEPTGTAGPPTLAVVRGADLGDVVLVVTRYFGGTKLGTGGLVYAYTNAAKEVLAVLPTEEKIPRVQAGVSVPYHLYERLKQICERYSAETESEEFGAEVTRYLRLPAEYYPAFCADLIEVSAGTVQPLLLD